MLNRQLRCWSVAACLLAVSCGLIRKDPIITMYVTARPGANQDTAIPVDLVIVWDKEVAKVVSELPSKDWFARKQQFVLGDPRGRILSVHAWEWVPGQTVPRISIKLPRKPRGVFLFAGYHNDAPSRAAIPTGTDTFVELGPDQLEIVVPEQSQIQQLPLSMK